LVKLKALYSIAIAETLSWVGLLTGMVMKYGFDNEAGVSLFGPIHGFLFLLYIAATLLCHVEYRWAVKRTVIVLLAAVPPFVGYFVVHGMFKDAASEQAPASLVS
jgi:integral membrane protein